MRTIFATEQPLLIAEAQGLLRRAGLPADPQVVGPEALAWAVGQEDACLALIDGASLPSTETLVELRRSAPQAKLVFWVNAAAPDLVQTALECGADGVLSRGLTPDEAAQALRRIEQGERQFRFEAAAPQLAELPTLPEIELSLRERQVLQLVAEGRNNAAIAADLHTTERHVRTCLHSMFEKTGTGNRRQLALLDRAGRNRATLPARESFDADWMMSGSGTGA